MDNDSGDRSIQVQDGENNDSRKQSPIPARHRNEKKDSLANKKQESQSRAIKRKKKSRKRKVSTSKEDLDSLPSDYYTSSNVGDSINRHRHFPRLPVIQVPTRNHIMTGFKLSLKMKILNGNYSKV